MELITTQLSIRFGDKVEVEYVDLAESANAERFPEMALLSQEATAKLPFVAVDGALRMLGGVEYRALVTAIEVLLEVRR